jgi:hypothetical protein
VRGEEGKKRGDELVQSVSMHTYLEITTYA